MHLLINKYSVSDSFGLIYSKLSMYSSERSHIFWERFNSRYSAVCVIVTHRAIMWRLRKEASRFVCIDFRAWRVKKSWKLRSQINDSCSNCRFKVRVQFFYTYGKCISKKLLRYYTGCPWTKATNFWTST